MTTVNALLKEVYEGKIEDQKNEEVIAVKRIESTSEGVVDTVGGKYVTFRSARRNAGFRTVQKKCSCCCGQQVINSSGSSEVRIWSIQVSGQ